MDYLQNGIEVSYHQNGESKSDIIYIADFENDGKPGDKNSYIVANQWTFIENSNKRPDILLFLNGLPVCLFELKSPRREPSQVAKTVLWNGNCNEVPRARQKTATWNPRSLRVITSISQFERLKGECLPLAASFRRKFGKFDFGERPTPSAGSNAARNACFRLTCQDLDFCILLSRHCINKSNRR